MEKTKLSYTIDRKRYLLFIREWESSRKVCVGQIETKKLPYYIREFDVCLLPYDPQSPVVQLGNPIKLLQFLAMKKPVVSTDFHASREYQEVIDIARDPKCFADLVQQAIEKDNKCERERRRHVAEENSWQQRIKLLERLIQKIKV